MTHHHRKHHEAKYHYRHYGQKINNSISRMRHVLISLALPIIITLLAGTLIGVPLIFLPSSSFLYTIITATASTLLRILSAYVATLIVGIPVALWVTKKPNREKFFLPILDIMESIPILAFFPIIILVFIHGHFLEGAAFFVLTISMLWGVIFAVVGGVKLIPQPINDFAKVFNIKGFAYFRKILLPSMFPELVTGSMISVGAGWNIIIVAEVLHTYVAGGTKSLDLFGLGSLLVSASANNQRMLFIGCVVSMVLVIALVNTFVWQKLLRASEKYRFD